MFNRYGDRDSGAFFKSPAEIRLFSTATQRADRPALQSSLVPRAEPQISGAYLYEADKFNLLEIHFGHCLVYIFCFLLIFSILVFSIVIVFCFYFLLML